MKRERLEELVEGVRADLDGCPEDLRKVVRAALLAVERETREEDAMACELLAVSYYPAQHWANSCAKAIRSLLTEE